MVVTMDMEPHLDIVMEITIEEVAIDVLLMEAIATTIMEENNRSSKTTINSFFIIDAPFFFECIYLIFQKV
jgi:hypothetical protein